MSSSGAGGDPIVRGECLACKQLIPIDNLAFFRPDNPQVVVLLKEFELTKTCGDFHFRTGGPGDLLIVQNKTLKKRLLGESAVDVVKPSIASSSPRHEASEEIDEEEDDDEDEDDEDMEDDEDEEEDDDEEEEDNAPKDEEQKVSTLEPSLKSAKTPEKPQPQPILSSSAPIAQLVKQQIQLTEIAKQENIRPEADITELPGKRVKLFWSDGKKDGEIKMKTLDLAQIIRGEITTETTPSDYTGAPRETLFFIDIIYEDPPGSGNRNVFSIQTPSRDKTIDLEQKLESMRASDFEKRELERSLLNTTKTSITAQYKRNTGKTDLTVDDEKEIAYQCMLDRLGGLSI